MRYSVLPCMLGGINCCYASIDSRNVLHKRCSDVGHHRTRPEMVETNRKISITGKSTSVTGKRQPLDGPWSADFGRGGSGSGAGGPLANGT
jgi:hypothetical protein